MLTEEGAKRAWLPQAAESFQDPMSHKTWIRVTFRQWLPIILILVLRSAGKRLTGLLID
ncbi:rCG24604 [Rattus norvegicus]|uniref:RCG24604 n=1 Tax=Rattus norvegicus TaxID=10116 RepID=A6JC75_RAT|nr:rCG24604 [Rattus norvegicus]